MRMKARMPGGARKTITSLAVLARAGFQQPMWQTPVADDAVDRKAGKLNSRGEPKLSAQVKLWPTPRTPSKSGGGTGLDGGAGSRSMMTEQERKELCGGSLNPTWVEWLMGWPLGWTDCAVSATAKCQQWCRSHGISYDNANVDARIPASRGSESITD
jgi:hypothetical protein